MKTVADLTTHAAGRYLQSAVFIDDEIFSRISGKALEVKEVSLRARKPTIIIGTQGASAPAKIEPIRPETVFHPREIVASFAQRGIVCALYEPEQDFMTDENSEVFKLCQAADLVILDWDFHKDDGSKMRELITALVTQSSKTIPHHSRLVVVYSTAPSLTKVASSLFDRLKQASLNPNPADSPLRLDVGATRVVVLGKISIARGGEEASFTVTERNLSTRVFEEFVLKNTGVLSSCALLAIAEVKRNSRRILAKFSPEMDGAFLLHRALLLQNEDAFEMLPPLIAEEFLSVIEDHFANVGNLSDVFEDKVSGMTIRCPQKRWTQESDKSGDKGGKIVTDVSDAEFTAITKSLLTNGLRAWKTYSKCNEVKKLSKDGKGLARGIDSSIISTLRKSVDAGDARNNERLAALFNARTYYDQQSRFLTLGTVIRLVDGTTPQYNLCLIPVCDAVRLAQNKSYVFPFLQLFDLGARGGNGCVLEDSKQNIIELVASPKIRGLKIISFTPTAHLGAVLAEKNADGFWLTSDDKQRYEWIGQLKPAHAQRIAHNIGQALSRVGLSEAEWVRLLCDKEQ